MFYGRRAGTWQNILDQPDGRTELDTCPTVRVYYCDTSLVSSTQLVFSCQNHIKVRDGQYTVFETSDFIERMWDLNLSSKHAS